MSRRATLASSIILLATSSLASHAEEPRARSGSAETQKAPESAKTDSANAAGTGLKAYIDPKTGKPGPVPAPTRRTEVVAPKSPFGLRNDALMWTETLEDGTIMLHTEGQVQMATFARFGEDGKPELYCEPVALKPEQTQQRPENNGEEKPK